MSKGEQRRRIVLDLRMTDALEAVSAGESP